MTPSNKQKWREPTPEEELTAPQVNGFTFWGAYEMLVGAVEPRGMGGDGTPWPITLTPGRSRQTSGIFWPTFQDAAIPSVAAWHPR